MFLGFSDIGYNLAGNNGDFATPVLTSLAENGLKLNSYYTNPSVMCLVVCVCVCVCV